MTDEPLSNKRIRVPPKEFVQSPVRPIKSNNKSRRGKAKAKGGGEERRKADTPTQSQSSNHQDVGRDTQIDDHEPLPWSRSPTPTGLQTQTMPPPPTPPIPIDPSLPTFERGTSQIPLRSIETTPAPPAPPPCQQSEATNERDGSQTITIESDGEKENDDGEKEKEDAYPWDSATETALTKSLLESKAKGQQNAAGFKGRAWKAAVEAVDAAQVLPAHVTSVKCQSKWNGWKRMWKSWLKHLDHISGWSPCTDAAIAEIGLPISTPEIMRSHYRVHGSCLQFRKKFPSQHQALEILLSDRLADGRNAQGIDEIIASDARSKEDNLSDVEEGSASSPLSSQNSSRSSSRSLSRSSSKKRKAIDLRVETLNKSTAAVDALQSLLQQPKPARTDECVLTRAMGLIKSLPVLQGAQNQKGRRAFMKKIMDNKDMAEVFLTLLPDDIAWFINDAVGWEAIREQEEESEDDEVDNNERNEE